MGEALGAPEEVESDKEDQDQEEKNSLGMADTVDHTEIGSARQMYFKPNKCFVHLTTKVQLYTILCGYF